VAAYLFHADAIAELLVPEPRQAFVDWLRTVPREEQYTSAISMAELYRGADASRFVERHRQGIEKRVVPAVTILPFDIAVARVFGELRAAGIDPETLMDWELQAAATALYHGLAFVTARPRRFGIVPGLDVRPLPRRPR
jgi:predicted nucleic acid-binding protein